MRSEGGRKDSGHTKHRARIGTTLILACGGFCFLFLAMSTQPRRSRALASASTAAPSPSTPVPARLLDLPTELLVRVFSRCHSPLDIARVAAVSLLFHASLALEGIRLWAQKRAASSCRRSQRTRAAPCGGCAVRRCYASPTRRRGRRQAFGTASLSSARGGSRRAAGRRTLQPCSSTARAWLSSERRPASLPRWAASAP